VIVAVSGSGTPLYYECIALGAGSSAPINGGGGYGAVTVPSNNSIYLKDINVASAGTYLFYARAVCAAGPGNWSAPATVNVNAYCARPYSLNYTANSGLVWSVDYAAAQHQVQYGLKGFTIGSGTTNTVTNTYFDDDKLNAATNYDFYVRSGCGAGWSSWVGPYSYLSTGIKNLCTVPSNLTYTVEFVAGVPKGASFSWSANGEKRFEFTWGLKGFNPATGIVNTHYDINSTHPAIVCARNTDFDLYVRAVCVDGGKTAWGGPMTFNIH
jgi:hypothetical protein